MRKRLIGLGLWVGLCLGGVARELPLLVVEDFESGTSRWLPTDAAKWRITEGDTGSRVYELMGKSNYDPPVRSPHSISILRDVDVVDFQLTIEVKTLQTSRAHRDMCLIFGYQDPAHFYYVHLGQATDPHANQIFVVDGAPRVAISETTNEGTPWRDGAWHKVKLIRRADEGRIDVYFDDMETPQMTATDHRFGNGHVGLGSFDDLGQWDNLRLWGAESGLLIGDEAADPKTLQFTKWSGRLNVPDPVALSIDTKGKVYATQTQRRKSQDLDIRQNRDWVKDDVGFQTIEDKIHFYHETLAPENSAANQKRVQDLNQDGSHDWRDLMALSERIHVLEDSDGDGLADRMDLFADGFQSEVSGIAAGVLWHEGDVYTTVAPDVWRLRDTDGDGSLDERNLIARGFGLHIAYAGHDMHGLTVGPDGKIYWTIGDKGISVYDRPSGRRWHYPNQGGMMRCNPDGSDFEVFAHGLRNVQELAFDEYGNWFGVDNDADQSGEKERFVHIVQNMDAGWRCNYQYRGEGYNPWMEEGLTIPWHEGQPAYIVPPIVSYEDGPAGFVYNPGTALNRAYRRYFFMTEAPRGNQWAFQVKPVGASFEMVHSHQIGAGVALVGLSWGPDGGLYGVDWGGGYPLNQSGAVWKIDSADAASDLEREEVSRLLAEGPKDRPVGELIALLGHVDQRVRLEAQFELVNRQETPVLIESASWGSRLRRIHAVWGLGQLARQKDEAAVTALVNLCDDWDSEIQVQVLKVLGDAPQGLFEPISLAPFVASIHPRVAFQAALSVGRHPSAEALRYLIPFAGRLQERQTYLRHAASVGLAACATRSQLVGLSGSPNYMKRLVAVLALRHLRDPGVRTFLEDGDLDVATEAARAIHDDFSIPAALPDLAKSLSGTRHISEAFLRRAVNANLRLGGVEDALRLVRFALASDIGLGSRVDALEALELWFETDVLDRVDGRRRELASRDRDSLRMALEPWIKRLFASENAVFVEKAVSLAEIYEVELDASTRRLLLGNEKAAVTLRLNALNSLGDKAAIAVAKASKAAPLRMRAATLEMLRNPLTAVRYLAERLEISRDLKEKQACFRILGDSTAAMAKAVLTNWRDRYERGNLEAGLFLDLDEALIKKESAGLRGRNREDAGAGGGYAFCLEGGDPKIGEQVFTRHLAAQCVRCHQAGANHTGSQIGPALRGIHSKGRAYLLRSLVDPQADIAEGFGTVAVTLKDGSARGGNLVKRTAKRLELLLPDGKVEVLDRDEVASMSEAISVMPPMGALLSRREIRDLLAYLMTL